MVHQVTDGNRPARRRFPRRRFFALATGALGALGTARWMRPGMPTAAAQETAPISPGAGTLYFAQTGHNLAEPFRSRWQDRKSVV